MNLKSRAVELRTSKHTTDSGALQKGADFLRAFTLGFDIDDAIALLRLDDLYIETFEIKDVKSLQGEHLGRAIGRIAGKDGKTKFAIENASRTRVVLADAKVHILGGFRNIHVAREAIVSLILGSPPGKVYGNLRTVSTDDGFVLDGHTNVIAGCESHEGERLLIDRGHHDFGRQNCLHSEVFWSHSKPCLHSYPISCSPNLYSH